MKKFSKIINSCQFSKKRDLVKVLSLGFLPGVNQMFKINSGKNSEIFFPTNLVYSPSSSLFQIDNIVDKEILFPKSYPYTSSTTKILRDNFRNLYEETNRLFKLKKDDLIVDIGSNDGNLLKKFKNCRVLGVTPEKIGYKAIKDGIPTIINYFNKKSHTSYSCRSNSRVREFRIISSSSTTKTFFISAIFVTSYTPLL